MSFKNLPQRARGGFPPDVATVVNTRWTEAILAENGLDVVRLRLIGVDIDSLASCVSLRLVDVEILRRDASDLDSCNVSSFNADLARRTSKTQVVQHHPGDLLGQCYHQMQAERGSISCGCDQHG